MGDIFFFFGLIDIFLVGDSEFIHPIRSIFFHRNGVYTANWVRYNRVNEVNLAN